jgi:hypothetical protein
VHPFVVQDFSGEGEDSVEDLRGELRVGLENLFPGPAVTEKLHEEVNRKTCPFHHRLAGGDGGISMDVIGPGYRWLRRER